MKTQIFNLIILDESGSMGGVFPQTISGCNETINTIRSVQEKHADTQEHFLSIYAFQGGGDVPSRYIIKNEPIEKVRHITHDDYRPWGNTPLYDAVGGTITDLKVTAKRYDDAIGSVTIITDGYENSSTRYTLEQVSKMISALKEIGWNFNFIGANIDVEKVSRSMNIDSSMAFQQDAKGTAEMFRRERNSRMAYYQKMADANAEFNDAIDDAFCATEEDMEQLKEKRLKSRIMASMNYFHQPEKNVTEEE